MVKKTNKIDEGNRPKNEHAEETSDGSLSIAVLDGITSDDIDYALDVIRDVFKEYASF